MDTPGLNDTEGIEQDACNLGTIYKMLNKHPALKIEAEVSQKRCFPNVVLLLLKGT